ncbi:MAG: hypothetical protein AAGB51_02430 [Planctomycetota bacterium]
MAELLGLWLPILVSSVVVFFLSGLFWQGPLHHKADINMLPADKEDKLFAMLKELNLDPKFYMFPSWAGMQSKDPEEKKAGVDRWKSGPWGTVNLTPGVPNYARNLGLTFASMLVATIVVGYLASLALQPGAGFVSVFQFVGTASVLGYALAFWPGSLFFGKPMRMLLLETIDGVVYGLVTGVIFGLLWPAAAEVAPAIPGG